MRKIITLLTDFGKRDVYAASMKGVILGINPNCIVVDLTHEVSPHDIREAGFLLLAVHSYFPKGSIHLSVVDPGVGSPRRPILLVTEDYFFVGPDNGVLTLAARREKVKRAIFLTNHEYFLPRISYTFHGRDVFAPVAAHLSLGVSPELLGEQIDSWVELNLGKVEREGEGRLIGEVVHVDSFGNLITNIEENEIAQCKNELSVRIKGSSIKGLKRGYWEGRPGEPIALIGSAGYLEISIREENASEILRAGKGDRVMVELSS